MGKVTIDSIQMKIESNSTNAAKCLDALAGSLEKLKKNGSFKTVANNLNNLSEALRHLPNVHSADRYTGFHYNYSEARRVHTSGGTVGRR